MNDSGASGRACEKACCRCKALLRLEMFTRDASKRDGFEGICKACKLPGKRDRQRAKYEEDLAYRQACVAATRLQRLSDPLGSRARRLQWRHDQREKLTDWWVRKLLASKKDGLKPREVPQALVDVKRQHLLLLRLVKQKEQ